MNDALELVSDGDRAVDVHRKGGPRLLRYVVRPDTPPMESPRPYAHPISTLAGEIVSGFRPNDHPWHHALSFTLTSLGGHNFWGGGSYRPGEGYRQRGDQGSQRHLEWLEKSPVRLAHRLAWCVGADGEILAEERRTLTVRLESAQAWSLRWQAELVNVSGRTLPVGNYHSAHGLKGSHYTGLQFRGVRALLDEHGDERIGVSAEGGLEGEANVHGAAAGWMEWRGQKDESLRRVTIRFVNHGGPLHWFVRRSNPLAAFPLQFDRDFSWEAGAPLALDHTLIFADA